jgi:hypothetical protein
MVEPTIYETRGEHATHYSTDALEQDLKIEKLN